MSWLHAELSEKASELGFESLEEAERNGYEISMDDMTPTLKPNVDKQLELAHKDWLERKEEILGELISVYNDIDVPKDYKTYLKHAIDFIKEGEI